MAPPPKYLIERKLIRAFTKKIPPKSPLIPEQYFQDLFSCWKTFGVGSSKCVDDQLKYDFAHQETRAFSKKIEGLKLRHVVTAHLKRPKYHSFYKGKFKNDTLKNYNWIKFHQLL